MNTLNTDELLTLSQAARLKDVSRQWIAKLVRENKLPSVEIAGRAFVRQRDVLSYDASPGRPPKSASKNGTKKVGKK
jgi:hypothetical protein